MMHNSSFVIDDLYNNITNNKIVSELPVSPFDQDNSKINDDVNLEIIDDTNYVLDLLNSFKNTHNVNSNTAQSFKSQNKSDNVYVKNSFLHCLSNNLKKEITAIKLNIQQHLDNQDFDCFKNICNSYKKAIQSVRQFLIEGDSNTALSKYVFFYLSYLYKITIVIVKNNIYTLYNYLNVEANEVLLFKMTANKSYELTSSFNNQSEFMNYKDKNTYIEYKSPTELNKLKISNIKELCVSINLDTNNTKNNLINNLNAFYEKFEKFDK